MRPSLQAPALRAAAMLTLLLGACDKHSEQQIATSELAGTGGHRPFLRTPVRSIPSLHKRDPQGCLSVSLILAEEGNRGANGAEMLEDAPKWCILSDFRLASCFR